MYNKNKILYYQSGISVFPRGFSGVDILAKADEQLARWKENVEEVLKQPKQINLAVLQPGEDLPVKVKNIWKAKIRSAIKSLRTEYAIGIDNLSSEAIQAGGEVSVETLYCLRNKFWREEKIPDEWKRCLFVKLTEEERCVHILPIGEGWHCS